MPIVLATNNRGKVAEISAMLLPLNLQVVTQGELNIPAAEETGLTFIENALLKARHASHYSNLPAIADDSGLVVPALQGAPGVYSSRYAGLQSTANDNNAKLLKELANYSHDKREAYFYCVMVYLKNADDPRPIIAEGIWRGSILTKPIGEKGFGYDPIFYDADEKCSAAELPLDKKNKLSHRGKALSMLIHKMKHNIE